MVKWKVPLVILVVVGLAAAVVAVAGTPRFALVGSSGNGLQGDDGDGGDDDGDGDDEDEDDDDDGNDDNGPQSDHALLDSSAGEHIYCGVGRNVEPWTLHVSASPGVAGTLTIQFRDASAVAFAIPAGQSFSLTQSMGGVPGVDDLVRIDLSSGGAWVSAEARAGALDPFVEPVTETDNFCINIPAEQAADTVGVTLAPPLPSAWVGAGNPNKLD